jgi:hypothetical protein
MNSPNEMTPCLKYIIHYSWVQQNTVIAAIGVTAKQSNSGDAKVVRCIRCGGEGKKLL